MILSGACTGDKLSPLSDSTNLAAGTAQTGLFDHVRAMMTTTLPSLCIAIILYAIISIKASGDYDPEVANGLSNAIVEHYEFMHPVLLIPFIAIFVVAILKVPALPGILLLSGLGGVFAVIFQHANFSDLITMWHYGYEAETGNVIVETFNNKDVNPDDIPGVLVKNHGPFSWGTDCFNAVHNAVVLEEVANMNFNTLLINPDVARICQNLLNKHYLRKHGANAYYGQKK
jgi:hypothetical protein